MDRRLERLERILDTHQFFSRRFYLPSGTTMYPIGFRWTMNNYSVESEYPSNHRSYVGFTKLTYIDVGQSPLHVWVLASATSVAF